MATATATRTPRPVSAATKEKKAAEREVRLTTAQQQFNAGLTALVTGVDWAVLLDTATKVNNYTLKNLLLIQAQLPTATMVCSAKRWHDEFGRYINKGETALRVYAPSIRKRTNQDTGKDEEVLIGWWMAPVFDISQTNGPDVPESPRPVLLDGEAPAGAWDALAGIVAAEGFELRRETIDGGANGYMARAAKLVVVGEHCGPAQSVKTLAHEVGHVLLGHDVHTGKSRSVQEVEAESVAYMVCHALGMDTAEYTFPYVAGWAEGDLELVEKTATRVVKTARTILEALEQD